MRLLTASLAALLAAAPALAQEIWVTYERDNSISVIDIPSLEVVRTSPSASARVASSSRRTTAWSMSAPRTTTRFR